MRQDIIYSKKWCDMVFENRNRQYGAYQIRRNTGRRYGIAITIVISLALIMMLPMVLSFFTGGKREIPTLKIKLAHMDGIKLREVYIQQKPKAQIHSDQAPVIDNTIHEEEVQGKELQTEILKNEIKFEPDKQEEIKEEDKELLSPKAIKKTASTEGQESGQILDSIPHYPTGIASFMKWLERTVIYPPECIRKHIQGTVVLAFIVEKDGTIAAPHIIESAGNMLDHEALRIASLMPPWKPAQKQGKPIRSQVTIPIVFNMNE